MDRHAVSADGLRIHYTVTGDAPTALIFAHGWLGNGAWWNAQRDAFADRYTVVQVDLAGHGASDRDRRVWSGEAYADDIRAVAEQVAARDVVLVGHSMSGAYVVAAAPAIPRTRAVILVDTLKNLDQIITAAQAAEMFAVYRADFAAAVNDVLPQYLFAPGTPPAVRARLSAEFLAHGVEHAIRVIDPLYQLDVRAAARRVTVPVRAINSDVSPTLRDVNRTYFADYDVVEIAGTGHYPMLERPEELNRLLAGVLGDVLDKRAS
jgi:sigma-B regulation protein RsbQ